MSRIARLAAAVAMVTLPARAATLTVGGAQYASPSAAIAAAQPGDTVRIPAGTYYDCAAWHTNRLTIEGPPPGSVAPDGTAGAVFSDRTCQDKAVFVIGGSGTVIRNLTFTRLRVPDRNAAGIRLESGALTVEDCVFDDDEAAIIAGDNPGGGIVLRRVTVRDTGVPGSTLPAIAAGAMTALRIEDGRFGPARGDGGALRSAAPTVITGSRFEYGAGPAPVLDVSGPLTVEHAVFHLTGVRPAAIRSTGDGVTVRQTTLENTTGAGLLLLQDWGSGPTTLAGNTVGSADTEESSSGSLMRKAKGMVRDTVGTLRHLAGQARRAAHL